MTRTVYLDGAYVPETQARVSVFDRGFLFADSVYEVVSVLRGRPVDEAAHLARLGRSLAALRIPPPLADADIATLVRELIARNCVDEGMVYLQISRGVAERDFSFPQDATPTVVAFTQARPLIDTEAARRGIRVVTAPDLRWQRCDIKTTALLAASMAKQAALDAGADDAWMVRDGFVTEGTSNNAFIVTDDRQIVTRRLGNDILPGVTRAALLALLQADGITVRESAFTVAEARSASEAFSSSASSFVMPVVEIDGHRIGDGKPGPVTRRLRQAYIDAALQTV